MKKNKTETIAILRWLLKDSSNKNRMWKCFNVFIAIYIGYL